MLLNEFRYLLMGIFAFYYALRVDNILLIPLMFILAMPVLIFLGWLSVHHMQKVIEWINIKFSTHWAMYNYRLNEDRNRLLEEIKDELRQSKNNS